MKKINKSFMLFFVLAFMFFIAQVHPVQADEENALVIVHEGQAQAAVVIASETDLSSKESGEILVEYVQKSTGVELPIMTIEELDGMNPLDILIYIGMNVADKAAVSAELKGMDGDGYIIFPRENDITIVGPTDRGTRNGVYDFLERYLGMLWLMPGEEWEHVPQQDTIRIPIDVIREEPDFPFRSMNMGGTGEDYRQARTDWQLRNRMHSPRQLEMVHNLHSVVPVNKYGETNPEFYPNGVPPTDRHGGWQPCFTEKGTVDVAIAEIIAYFDRNPNATSFSLSPNDRGGYCEADPSHPYYPGKLNSLGLVDMSDIFFAWVNEVVEGVLEVHPGKWFGVYAYQEVMDPPSFPVHPQVVPIITKDRLTWLDEDVKDEGHRQLEDWQAVATQTGWYEYLYGYQYLLPRIYFNLMAENYKYAKEHDVTVHHADFHPSLGDGPKGWLAAKLQWDADQDIDSLLQEWYEAAVGPEAAPYLSAYFDLWERFWMESAPKSGWFQSKGNTYLSLNNVSYLGAVTEEEIHESRSLLEAVFAKTETPEQQVRAEQMLHQFEFYEASALSYPRPLDRPVDENAALGLLANVQSQLESRLHYVQQRYDLIEEFENNLSLKYPADPFRVVWTGWNEYEFWYLHDYMNLYEASGGAVTDQVRTIAQRDKASKTRDFARLLLETDMKYSLTGNPSFENGNDEATAWTFWNPEGGASITRTDEISRTGEASIKFENTSLGGVYQIHPIKPGLVASEVHYYTPPGTQSNGTIRLVIEAFNVNGEKLVYSTDSVRLSETAGEWASIGFLEEIPEQINNQAVDHVLVNAQIHNAQGAQVYQDDFVVYQNVPSSVDLMALVDRYREEAEIRDDQAAHQLNMHLTAIDHFERQQATGKVYQHMNDGFMMLLSNLKGTDRISADAYDALQAEADSMIQRIVNSQLQMTMQLSRSEVVIGESPSSMVMVQVQNTGKEIIERPIVTVQWPEEFGKIPEEKNIQILDAGESAEVMFETAIPEDIPAGSFPIQVHVQFNHDGVEMQDTKEQLLQVLPMIETSWNIEQLEAHKAGDYPVSLRMKSNSFHPLNVTVESEAPEYLALELANMIHLEPGQQISIDGNINISQELLEGAHEVLIRAIVDDKAVHESPLGITFNRNLVRNPGFEEVEEHAAGHLVPVGWNLRSSAQLDQDEVRSGEFAVTMIADPENTWQVMNSQDLIPVADGADYRLSGWVKTDGYIDVMLREIDGDNATIKYNYIRVVGNEGWQYFEQIITPSVDAVSMNVFFHISANNANQAWFDDIRLEEVEPDNNLFKNASFEEIVNGAPVSWNSYGAGWTDAVSISPEAARTGENGIKMTTETSSNYLIGQSVTVEAGKTYELSAWLKSDILAGGRAQMKIDFYKDRTGLDNWRGHAISEAFGSYADWENIKMEVVVPDDANLADILIRLYGPGTAHYDDVAFRLVD